MSDATEKTKPSDVPPPLPANRDEGINAFLRSTHQAWRTLKIPGVAFPEDSVLPLNSFIAKYRSSTLNEAMLCFWSLFSPIPADEFMISFYYHRGHFGIGRQLWFMLTSRRLILWDTTLKRHQVISLEMCSGFTQPTVSRCIAQFYDGQTVEINNTSTFFSPSKSTLNTINGACKWARAKPEELARPIPVGVTLGGRGEIVTPPAAPAYAPDLPSASLRWYYAQRGAAWATSLPVVIWLIAIFNAGSGAIILPGFLGIMLLGLIGFGGGYMYGYSMESETPNRGTTAEPFRKAAEGNEAGGKDTSKNDGAS